MKSDQSGRVSVALLAAIAVIFLGFIAFYFLRDDPSLSPLDIDETSDDIHRPRTDANSAPVVGDQETETDQKSLVESAQDDAALLAQQKWEVSRGYLDGDSSYLRNLSDDEFETLIEQGNTQALRVFASRELVTNPVEMINLYEKAVLMGDIPALLTVAASWSNPHVHRSAEAFSVSPNPAVNTLAIILTAQLRGDNVLAPQHLDQAFKDYGYDSRMVSEACGAAKRLMNILTEKRIALGHTPFDNTPSPLGQAYPTGNHISATCDTSHQ